MKMLALDSKFKNHFRNLKQVFIYLTDECNLNCIHCLYKPSLTLKRAIPYNVAKNLIYTFQRMGAFKLTILGGEATLYYDNEEHDMLSLVRFAKHVGYQYVRLDTNGHFNKNFTNHHLIRFLDEISFSIDGFNKETNDSLRGDGSFDTTIYRLRQCVDAGINVHITSCVTKENTTIAGSVYMYLDQMIQFAQAEKVNIINFHGVFEMGIPMDAWTKASQIDADDWIDAYERIRLNMQKKVYTIPVRLPIHLIREEAFDLDPEYFGYCPCKLGERVLVHPSGQIRICSTMLSSPYCIAKYDSESIRWEDVTNELYKHDMDNYTPCANQVALKKNGQIPVCFSLKPRQVEPVWYSMKECGIIKEDG